MKDYKTSPDSKINFFKKKISSFQRKKNTNKNTILVYKFKKITLMNSKKESMKSKEF